MGSETGHLWLLYVDKTAVGASTPNGAVDFADADWQLVAGQRGLDRSSSLGTADATTKDSANQETLLPTNLSREISIDAIGDLVDDAGQKVVELAQQNRLMRWYKVTNGQVTWYYHCLVTSFDFSAPEDDVVSLSITLKPSGTPTRVPALT